MADSNVSSVLKLMKDNDCDILDLKFIDVPGTWQHVALPISEVNDALFEKGTGFDGSSVRGFQTIDESDMLLLPHAETAKVDPFMEKTVSIIADIRDPLTNGNYTRDPRYITIKAEQYLKDSGVGDTSYWGPELEFFVFDSVQFFQKENEAYFKVDSDEGIWNSGSETMIDGGPNIGQRPGYKGGYFPASPIDTMHDMRGEMTRIMIDLGIEIEKHHHEVATGGQGEIDLRYDTMLSMADKVMRYKYVVKNVAQSWGKVATFMPKPLFNDNGTGMHTHQSIWKDGKPLFAGKEYAGLSKMALNYIGGIIKHGRALMGLCAPTSNSYKRLVPGFEAPTILALSARNRSAACRVPMYFDNPAAKRVEFRSADPTCNPYLAFPAMLMAGLDGIENGYDPGEALEDDLFELSNEEQAKLKQVPGSIEGALDALEEDHDFLLKGDVFTSDLLEAFISYKRETEVDEVRTRPHPWEYFLTFNS
ncbi:MAG: type I glutamate--ammonia ligase [Chloroflexota bacterium]|nr:type I glutamate--ammonia ligase [Chloroflexota bacterium]MEC9451731.1 type I glutamate--ammonia ligase [Chloroflexota bacterium]MQG04748.1 type I glutamate--ammonia ligase [SAR202 cluster bacterium]|tara:strand:- start:1631 stop:3061 length:1431 start_codon:yes stop_codon:yes gene_type:complete